MRNIFKREATTTRYGFKVTESKAAAADYIRAYCAQTTAVQRALIAAELANGASAEQVAKSIRKVSGFQG